MVKLTTQEQIAESISNFLSNNPNATEKDSLVDLYNMWSLTTNSLIEGNDLVEYAVRTLHDMLGIDKDLLQEAIELLKK